MFDHAKTNHDPYIYIYTYIVDVLSSSFPNFRNPFRCSVREVEVGARNCFSIAAGRIFRSNGSMVAAKFCKLRASTAATRRTATSRVRSRDRSRLTLAPGRGAGAGCRRVKSREDKSRLIQNAYREKSRARIYRSVAIPASCAVPVPPSRFARARLVTSRYTGKSGM